MWDANIVNKGKFLSPPSQILISWLDMSPHLNLAGTTSPMLCYHHCTKPSNWKKNWHKALTPFLFSKVWGLVFCFPSATTAWEEKLCNKLNLCKRPRRCNRSFHGPSFHFPARPLQTRINTSPTAMTELCLHTEDMQVLWLQLSWPSWAKGLARSALSSAVPLTKHPELC